MAQRLPSLLIDLRSPAPSDLSSLFPHAPARIVLEIGFGGGEHLLDHARRDPDAGFIGVEPFVNSLAKLVTSLETNPRSNIRLHDDDATQLLDWLPARSIHQIDLLYPDPWPKKRHFKRRFVSQVNLDRFARVMKPGGLFRFASDIDTYVNWTLQHVDRHSSLEWPAEGPADWQTPYAEWPGTRYEAKAVREGRTPAYLTFRRI